MKKIYLKPELKEVTVCSMRMLNASKLDFMKKPESEEDAEVDNFDLLL